MKRAIQRARPLAGPEEGDVGLLEDVRVMRERLADAHTGTGAESRVGRGRSEGARSESVGGGLEGNRRRGARADQRGQGTVVDGSISESASS